MSSGFCTLGVGRYATKYVATSPKPKPRTPKPKPRTPVPKPIAKKVKELIDVITPYYRPEAISKFAKELRDKKILE